MAVTINPAVSGVSYSRWLAHVAAFGASVGVGAFITYVLARLLFSALALASPYAWLLFALPLIGLGALRDLGVSAPVPYPERRQVPEWFRRVAPPGATAVVYGTELGIGFLTRFTYSTHLAFIVLVATQPPLVAGIAVMCFAAFKSIVVLSSPAGRSYPEANRRLMKRQNPTAHGQRILRHANAVLALATAGILIVNL